MSTLPDNELDLEKLFLPAWAQEPASAKQYANYQGGGEDRGDRRGDRRGPRPPRRDGPGGPGGPRGNRPPGGERRGPRPEGGRGPRPEGGRAGRPSGPRRDFDRGERREPRRETPPPLPEVNVALAPDGKGVESLARQIKVTARAYPLFDIARLILQKPERYSVVFSVKKNAEGKPVQPLFLCALDDSLWLSEDEAIAHVLNKHFATFYQAERTQTEPPKGTYTFVAQCGMSGVILGPPNYHDYQNQLRKLHAERFSRMPFDVFKARVKIVKDEAVVKKWIEEQSSKTEYTCLNVAEPLKLASMEEVEKHFRATHKDSIIKAVDTLTIAGTPSRTLRSTGLQRLIRNEWDHQRQFPLPVATKLSQQFASHGLQFFKVNKTITHVSVARPQYLDIDSSPVSDGIKKIVQYINSNPKCTRKKLIEALAPTPAAVPAPAPETAAPAAPAAEGDAATAAPAPAKPAEPKSPEPTPEQTAVMVDLHWLIHQGAVLEFADGRMETAKKPLPKPPKPEKKEEKATEEATVPTMTEAPAAATESAPATDLPATAAEPTASVETAPAPAAEAAQGEEPPAPATESAPTA